MRVRYFIFHGHNERWVIRQRLSAWHVCFIWMSVYSVSSLCVLTVSRRLWLSAHLWLNSVERHFNLMIWMWTAWHLQQHQNTAKGNDCMDTMYWLYKIKWFLFFLCLFLPNKTDSQHWSSEKSACCQVREVTVASFYLHKIRTVLPCPSCMRQRSLLLTSLEVPNSSYIFWLSTKPEYVILHKQQYWKVRS